MQSPFFHMDTHQLVALFREEVKNFSELSQISQSVKIRYIEISKSLAETPNLKLIGLHYLLNELQDRGIKTI